MDDLLKRLRTSTLSTFVLHEAADEIERLQKERDELQMFRTIQERRHEEQLSACQKDAERYRWLRDYRNKAGHICKMWGEALDNTVDREMKEQTT